MSYFDPRFPSGTTVAGTAPYADDNRRQERRLVLAAKGGDRAACDELVTAFQPLIAGVARIYRGSPAVDQAELMQEGVVGLLTGLHRYDLDTGTPFWGYACWWVRLCMLGVVAALGRPVVLSDRALRQLARLRAADAAHMREYGREPTLFDLAAGTGFTKEQVESLLAVERPARGLDTPRDGEGGSQELLVDTVVDAAAEDAYDRVLPRFPPGKPRRLGRELCRRESAVLRARFGLDGPEQTLRQIGSDLGLSAERVRRIEERALEKLRAEIAC
jgi:DNA-directed RNA polymerase sigma subunit (sigma70/sigma32)